MFNENLALIITAAYLGFLHVIFGPDHYLPFIALSKTNKWSISKTGFITLGCGICHIISAVLLGIIGILFTVKLKDLQIIDSFRNEMTAWLFISIGILYLIWGLRNYFKKKTHENKGNKNIFWILFIIFILGPCEPLIPLLIYPAYTKSIMLLLSVIFIFGFMTILTMLGIVLIALKGINLAPQNIFEKYGYAISSVTLTICGLCSLLL